MASDVWAEKLLSKYWFEPWRDELRSSRAERVESLLLLLLLQAPDPEDQDVCVCSVDFTTGPVLFLEAWPLVGVVPGGVASGLYHRLPLGAVSRLSLPLRAFHRTGGGGRRR